jgi:hypothetical protein
MIIVRTLYDIDDIGNVNPPGGGVKRFSGLPAETR